MKRERWSPPRCSSGKAAYRSQGRALRALAVIEMQQVQAAEATGSAPRATYRCPECGAWHLTRNTDGGIVRRAA